MANIENIVNSEMRKWTSIDLDIYFINQKISECYKFFSGNYEDKKMFFIKLHYIKMLKNYIYLKIYNDNIKNLSSIEKLLYYFENILKPRGFKI